MLRKMSLLPMLSLVLMPTISSGATIDIFGLATAGAQGYGGNVSDYIVDETLEATMSEYVSAYSPENGSSAYADVSGNVDARTGELRFDLSGQRDAFDCTTNCDAQYGSSFSSRLSEEILVSGTGTLTVFMQVDAFWSSPRWNFVASAGVSGASLFDIEDINLGSYQNPDLAGVSRLLTASVDLSGAIDERMLLDWRLQGDIAPINDFGAPFPFVGSYMDASNTATIFFEASDGLSVSDVTDGFLSDAAYLDDNVAPVPLPASLPMLMAGVFGIGWVSRKRSDR